MRVAGKAVARSQLTPWLHHTLWQEAVWPLPPAPLCSIRWLSMACPLMHFGFLLSEKEGIPNICRTHGNALHAQPGFHSLSIKTANLHTHFKLLNFKSCYGNGGGGKWSLTSFGTDKQYLARRKQTYCVAQMAT